MTKQLIIVGTAVMTTLLALIILWQFRIVVIYALISLTLAAAVRPLVKRLLKHGFLLRLAWIVLYLAALSIFGLLIYMAVVSAVSEIQHLAQSVSVQDAWKLPVLLEGSVFQQLLVGQLPPPSKLFEAVTGSQWQLVLPAIFGFTQGIADVVGGIFVVLFLSLYWIVDQIHFERLWLSLLPSVQRKQARDIWRTIEPNLGAYIRSQIVFSLLAGIILFLGYWVLGSPYPTLLALAGALACLLPMVGAPLALISPLIVGLLTGVQLSLFTVLYTLIVLIVLGIWVKPRLFNRRWDNPILTLVILIALANAFGLLGILVAPPISAVCQILWSLLISHRLASGAAAQVSDLKERQEHVWATIREMDGTPLPLVTSSMERLNRLIVKAEPFLEVALPAESSEPLLNIVPQPEQEKNNGSAQNS